VRNLSRIAVSGDIHFRSGSCALDDRAAIFTAVPDAGAAGTFQFFEIVVPLAEFLQAFRTTIVAQVFPIDRQVTMAAAHRPFSDWQKLQSGMSAGVHELIR
jgi:hypothetical protein